MKLLSPQQCRCHLCPESRATPDGEFNAASHPNSPLHFTFDVLYLKTPSMSNPPHASLFCFTGKHRWHVGDKAALGNCWEHMVRCTKHLVWHLLTLFSWSVILMCIHWMSHRIWNTLNNILFIASLGYIISNNLSCSHLYLHWSNFPTVDIKVSFS